MKKFNLNKISKFLIILMISSWMLILACAQPAPAPSPTPGPTPKPEAKTFPIGVLVCLTGWFSTFDTLEWEEAQIARDMLNEAGGINIGGQKYLIELIAEDCKSTNEGVVAATNKLVYDKKVKFIAGPAAHFAAAANQVTEPNKVLRTSAFNTCTPEELGANTPYSFLCHNGTLEHAVVGINALKKVFPNVKTVDFVNAEAGGTVKFYSEKIRQLLKDNGVTMVGEPIVFPDEMADFSPIAAKLATSKTDGVFFGNGLPEHGAKILKGLRELGNNKPIVFMSSASPDDIKAIAGEPASTYFTMTGITTGMPDTPAIMAEMQKRLLTKYGKERSIHFQIVNSIWCIAKAAEKAQSLDPTVVRDTWTKMDTIETPYGTGHIGGLKTYGVRQAVSHPEPYLILEGGKSKFGAWVDVRMP